MSEPLDIPDKLYFRIGDVATILNVRPHVLRYWESEFPSVRPEKSRTNQRLYQRRDIERLAEVKRLLYDEGYTIAGARKRLRRGVKVSVETTGGDAAPKAETAVGTAGPTTDRSGLQSDDLERIRVAASEAAEAEAAKLEERCSALEQALASERAAHCALRHRMREELEAIRSLVRPPAESVDNE